jgi:hypothetical protein
MSRDHLERADEEQGSAAVDDDGRELDQRIADYLSIGLPMATLVCAIVGGVLQGAAAVVLVLAGGALVSVIAIFWASIRTLVGEAPLSGADAYVLGAPRAEEERKRAVLRALKDLEFERGVGKISEEDYEALAAKYRAEAKRLLRMLEDDAQPGRHKVEALVMERLFQEGLAEPPQGGPYRERKAVTKSKKRKTRARSALQAEASPGAVSSRDSRPEPQPPVVANVAEVLPAQQNESDADARRTCVSCGTRNDADAMFCKRCGARCGAAASSRDEEEEESAAGAADVSEKASQGEGS